MKCRDRLKQQCWLNLLGYPRMFEKSNGSSIPILCTKKYMIVSSLFFLPFLGDFCFLEEFWIFLEEKRGFMAFWRLFDGLMAFWRHFRPFGGSLVGFSGFSREIW